MTTRGDSLGLGARPDLGVGVSTPPLAVVEPSEIIYSSWQRGLITADAPEDIPKNSAQDACDVRIDRNDSLIRLEGVSASEDVSPKSLRYIFQHASLDFSTELVVIDPPYLGYRGGASTFTWVNLGIGATGSQGWNAANVAGTLVFSNGRTKTYAREPGAAIITDISANIIAETFGTAFGRVFAGAYTDAITGLQSLAIVWNGTSNPPYSDFASLNSGGELLISNNMEADRIVAIRAIGFDALAILTRKAVWMGYQTGQANHPAQFRLRFPGLGCVAEPTVAVTPVGIVYLNDEGVVLCQLNSANVISTEINSRLLPLDYSQISKYRAVYQPVRDRYVLQTPTGTWYYEFQKVDANGQVVTPARWYFSSFVPLSLVVFTDQNANVYWNIVQGTWADQTLTWDEMDVGEENAPPVVFFGTIAGVLGFEDPGATTNLGTAQTPFWTTAQNIAHESDQISTIWFEVEYKSTASCQVQFATQDADDSFTNTRTITLPNTVGRRRAVVFGFTGTGSGAAIRLTYVTGSCNIFRVRQVYLPAGPLQTAVA